MLWFRTPEKVYFKKGCMPVALDELGPVMGKKKCFIVTDTFLYKNGYVKPIEEKLDQMGTFPQYPHTLERYAECAHFCGVSGRDDKETLELFIAKIEELKAAIGIKKSIREYGIDEKCFLDNLEQMVEDAFDDQCTGANPRYPLMSEIKEMYLRAYYGNMKPAMRRWWRKIPI